MLWLLSGCTSIDWCARFNLDCDTDITREDAVDRDEDVWTEDEDCNDSDPYTYPYAPELCDNRDNDCDGVGDVEEGLAEWLYRDGDADGFGDPDSSYFHCLSESRPEGWVPDATDCDDTSAQTHPSATETCDLRDNNCNDEIDEGVLRTFYIDADVDGSGAADKTTEGCIPPEGYVTTATDCDDSDDRRHPLAEEVCDRIDNNCNDEIDEAQCTSSLSDAPVTLSGNKEDDRTGNALSSAGDLNGDGYDDILIGAHLSDTAGENAGAVYVLSGPLTGALDLPDDALRLLGESESDQLGRSLAAVGDINQDGYDDVLIGASSARDGRGRVYLLHGPLSADTSITDAAAAITGTGAEDYHGRSVAGLGDTDGDGHADIGVGAWGSDGGAADAGAVYVYAGPISGTLTASDATGTLLGASAAEYAGWSVAGAGDTDGDGLDDVLIGACGMLDETGGVYLVTGPISGSVSLSATSASFRGDLEGDYTGWSVAGAGDVDGDGLHDILIGAPRADAPGRPEAGATWLLHGPITGDQPLSSAGEKLLGTQSGNLSGFSVSGVGDRDGDGLSEILIGAYGISSETGGAYLLRSDSILPTLPGSTMLSVADWSILGASSGDQAGVAVGAAGDVNGDGLGDMLIGAPERNGRGAAYLLY